MNNHATHGSIHSGLDPLPGEGGSCPSPLLREAGASQWGGGRRKFQQFVSPTDTVVDFGCGAGFTLARLQAGSATGVEVNEESRRVAESIGIQTVASADLLPEQSADVVISNHCLEHTLSPLTELQRLLRVLKPGGLLVLYVPVDDWRLRRQRRVDPDVNHHLYTWTPLLLANLLREAGFANPNCRVEHRGLPGRAICISAPCPSPPGF